MNNKRLFDLREYHDLYQKDIAKEIGVSQQSYSLWEKGTKIIPLKHLNKLCSYYKLSTDYILGLTNQKDSNTFTGELDKKVIGKNIKNLREKLKMTTRDLAKELNTSSSTITGYETGKTLILTAFAFQLCKNHNVSMDNLLGRKKNN